MISKLSRLLTERMLSSGTICEADKELYVYGLFMLLSQIMFFIITCTFGFMLSSPLESIVFYIAFMLIRQYAGGYHASTEAKCDIMSASSILACIVVIKLSKLYDFEIALLIIGAVSAVCIAVLCPLDTPEKPLSGKEFKYFRRQSLIILFVITAIIGVSYFFELKLLAVPCLLSLILENILLIAGKIKKALQSRKSQG